MAQYRNCNSAYGMAERAYRLLGLLEKSNLEIIKIYNKRDTLEQNAPLFPIALHHCAK
jgi:hypothetical protein